MFQKEVLENKIANIKLAGNMLYSQNDFIHSARKYKKARRYIEYMLAATDLKCEFDKEKFNHVYLLCLLNGAAVYIKLGDFKEANNLCNEVITFLQKSFCCKYVDFLSIITITTGLKARSK